MMSFRGSVVMVERALKHWVCVVVLSHSVCGMGLQGEGRAELRSAATKVRSDRWEMQNVMRFGRLGGSHKGVAGAMCVHGLIGGLVEAACASMCMCDAWDSPA